MIKCKYYKRKELFVKNILKKTLPVAVLAVFSAYLVGYSLKNADWQTPVSDTVLPEQNIVQNAPEKSPENSVTATDVIRELRENTALSTSGYTGSEGVYQKDSFAVAMHPAENPESFPGAAKYYFDATLDDGTVVTYYDYYLRPHMGYITLSDGKTVTVFDANLSEIAVPQELSLSFAKTRDRDGNPVLVDRNTGKYYIFSPENAVVESDYEKVRDFRGVYADYARDYGVSDDERFEILSSKRGFGFSMDGKEEVIPVYKKAFNYSEGFGCTFDAQNRLYFFNNEGRLRIGGLAEIMYGAGDVNDERALGYYYFDEGLTRITKKTFSKGKLVSSRETFVNRKGDEVRTPADYSIYSYSNGRILLTKDGRYGYMTPNGRWICEPDFTFARPFFEGLAVVGDADGKKGIIDRDGNFVVPQVFDEITDCSGGLICAYDAGTGWHVIQKLEIVPPETPATE